MIRRTIALIAAALVAVGVPLTQPQAAHAAPPEILVSTDGVNFAPSASVQLFDDIALIVPGDTTTGRLWIRNHSSTAALVRVAVNDLVVPSPEFGAAVTLSSTMNGFTYVSSFGALSNCQIVVQPQNLAAGQTLVVDAEVSMSSATSGQNAQGETASLSFVVTAHEWAAGPFADDNGCSAGASGGSTGGNGGSDAPKLPFTGAEVGQSLAVALAMLALGALFAVLRRRRRDEQTHAS
ncbi:LPXTG cell wall anchor domain-containing protein [Protaetiibacter sp. SSC-01]|uniref:LPXTG cell wall anchor domain-containing protein n=1 Tax=Protaetiibacter sp. SSC-01 TaxID=2759943 RepID=UPI0016571FEB|nr:LPXTG cell wall anchor domain-containing protein [Protaetiibacter sp. SSC-01]QNO36772.1 LPXTG cell wall anchor domain-containing protein [Protaetiibacter sp. SSC-01]